MFKGSRPDPSDGSLADVELAVGAALPREYVVFLRQRNGGHPQLDTFGFGESTWAVNNFFYAGEDAGSTESLAWNYANRPRELGTRMLPFARDGGGNLLCFDLTTVEGSPPVFIWIHDAAPESRLLRLADSFDAFLAGLHENPDYI